MQNEFDDPTPTQKIYAPVANLDMAYDQAFKDFQNAMARGDLQCAERARIRISEIEIEQRAVHQAARAYLLSKAQK